jgi:hypothetical protein
MEVSTLWPSIYDRWTRKRISASSKSTKISPTQRRKLRVQVTKVPILTSNFRHLYEETKGWKRSRSGRNWLVPHLFSYLFTEAETNTKAPETSTKSDTTGNKYVPNMVQTRTKSGWLPEPRESCDKTQTTHVKLTNLFPNPITIARRNGK